MSGFTGKKETVKRPLRKSSWKQGDYRGQITKVIGTGENAQHSLVLIVIIGLAVIFLLITVGIFVNCWYFGGNNSGLINDVIDIWEKVFPVITLALGYSFGKRTT